MLRHLTLLSEVRHPRWQKILHQQYCSASSMILASRAWSFSASRLHFHIAVIMCVICRRLYKVSCRVSADSVGLHVPSLNIQTHASFLETDDSLCTVMIVLQWLAMVRVGGFCERRPSIKQSRETSCWCLVGNNSWNILNPV